MGVLPIMAKTKVQLNNNPPFQLMICGTNHSGKTTLCNALRGADSPGNLHTSSIDTYDIPIEDGSKLRLLDFAGSYEHVVPYLRQHYIEQSQICVVCIDRENTHSLEVAKMAVKEIRELDPDKKIVIALTKEDKYLKLRDYEIVVKDWELNKLKEEYDLIGSIKTSAINNREGAAELRSTLLQLREEIILREEKEVPDISSLEEYFPEEESLDEVIRRMHNLSALFHNAQIELSVQEAMAKKESNTDAWKAINKSIKVVSSFSDKLDQITKIPGQMKSATDVQKRDLMVKAYEAAFSEFASEAKSELLTVHPPKNVKPLIVRLVRALYKFRWHTDAEKTEIERVKHQTDFKNRLQMEEGRYKEKNSSKTQPAAKKDDTELDSSMP